jgi:hypothetical protein
MITIHYDTLTIKYRPKPQDYITITVHYGPKVYLITMFQPYQWRLKLCKIFCIWAALTLQDYLLCSRSEVEWVQIPRWNQIRGHGMSALRDP